MSTLDALLHAVVADPQNEDRYLVLADFLEEHDDARRAELLRLHRRLLATCCAPEKHPERAQWHARVVTLIGQGVRPCVPRRSVVLADGVEMGFAFVPPGTFLMGSRPEELRGSEEWRNDSEVLHRVTLTRGFWLATHPVTQAQWQAVLGNNPSHFRGDDRPVEQVSWDDGVAFCGRLGETFRLPTEAQWEYACRAGTTTAYYPGDELEALQRAGWCSYNGVWGSAGQTKPVGQLEPNAWGLFDLHGNVDEWCADWYGPYEAADVVDPRGTSWGDSRVTRGGSWFSRPGYCRSGIRHCDLHIDGDDTIGFRVVLCPDE